MGVNPTWRSSSWFYDSTCIAPTVEIVCFQQHISACSVDKGSRNWLMDVFKYTQCIFQILSNTCCFYSATDSRSWNSNFGHFVALTATIYSESSDSEPDEAEFDETPRQASHEHITSI